MSNSSRLQLSLNARGMRNLAGLFNTSDPFAVVTIRGDDPENCPMIAGQTEVVYNNLSPKWSTVIFLDGYKFGVPFYIEVGIFDFQAKQVGKNERQLSVKSSEEGRIMVSTDSSHLLRAGKLLHKVMGTALFEVGEVLGQRGNVASKSLQTGGAVYVHIERSLDDGIQGLLLFQLRGRNISNTHTLGKASPFFELCRKVDRPTGAIWSSVYRSNVVRSNLNPRWSETDLSMEVACNGDLDRDMKIIVFDHRRSGKHKVIGEFETTIRLLIQAKENGGDVDEDHAFALRHRGENIVGHILVLQAQIVGSMPNEANRQHPISDVFIPVVRPRQRPQFVDYLAGGCQISLAVAIDFSSLNGDPGKEGTPHYVHPSSNNEWNHYEKAMFAVGSILAKYDHDALFPVWGFGAEGHNKNRKCFQCGDDLKVRGVEGIMEVYRNFLNTTFSMTETGFTEVIKTAARYAKHEQQQAEEEGELSYTILLVLTAGNVDDVRATKQELISASSVPMSVVIVGIGDGDFERMEFLDEHDPSIEEGRDITKFVKFNAYHSYNVLTGAVLDEIPDQLVDYYFTKGILPGEAQAIDHDIVSVMSADDGDRTVNFLGSCC